MMNALPLSDCSTLLETAIRAARAAGIVLSEHARSGFRIEFKAAINLVTDADRRAEDCIVQTILAAHPSHRILAEERGQGATSRMDFRSTLSRSDSSMTVNVF
jgi:myo-inositol-1(or 4)-monophosphatase